MKTEQTIQLDLLIVGGGIQGLTLLHHYVREQRGSVVLVNREPLGTGETLHSHGYLHRGYSLPPEETSLIPDLAESFDWWERWSGENQLQYEEDSSVLFDLSEESYEATTRIWKEAGLRFEPLDELPAPLKGGSYSQPNSRRLTRIHDRLIAPWEIVKTLSDPLQHLLFQGELTDISWDPETNRIVECAVSTAGTRVNFRPESVVIATGRDTQPLLRKIASPDGTRPLDRTLRDLNLIREVPMVLVKGAGLPRLSGWFFIDAPISMMTHPLDNGGRMWVITLMEGHRSAREDFRDAAVAVDEVTIRRTIGAVWDLVPAVRDLTGRLRFSSYVGAKIDHPKGLRRWYVGDGGIDNLRFVWPVLWGSAYGASRQILRELPAASHSASFDAGEFHLSMGVQVGEEERLSSSRVWFSAEQWKTTYGLDL